MKRRIAPGIWEDMNGTIHWSIPELLALVELPDIPENRERVRQSMEKVLHENAPGQIVIFREKDV